MIDDAMANIQALGEVAGAYTTGTPANLALLSATNSLATTLGSGVSDSGAALSVNAFTSPADITAATDTAGYLACSIAAFAWLTNLQTVLNRP